MADKIVTVAGKPTITKDPEAVLDYQFDWRRWLASHAPVDTIASIVATGSAVTVDSSSHADGIVTVWISGGTVGTEGSVVCRIVTTGGRTDERTLFFRIEQR